MERSGVAILIPAYNEETTIAEVVRRVRSFGEVIVVDDASSDNTKDLAGKSGATVLSHPHNLGYDGALDTGFRYAWEQGFRHLITFDADGQHEPSLIADYTNLLTKEGYQLVVGKRPEKARLAERVMGVYFRFRFGVRDILCGMKGYHMELFRANGGFDHVQSIGSELAMMSIKRGCRFAQLPVEIHGRRDTSRFGNRIKGNIKIVRALFRVIWMDLWGLPARATKPGTSDASGQREA